MQECPLDAATEERLAGCSWDEWYKVQEEHLAKMQAGRRHKETDYGQGYIEGRWGKDARMGWVNYSAPTPAQLKAPHTLANEPLYRLNRHLWHASQTGDVQLIHLLVQCGAQVDSCNNESFLPATVRYGLTRPHSHDAASSCNQPATLGITESFNALCC